MFSLSRRTDSPPIMTDERRKWAGKVVRKLHFASATFSASWFPCATHRCSSPILDYFSAFLTPSLRPLGEKCGGKRRKETRAYDKASNKYKIKFKIQVADLRLMWFLFSTRIEKRLTLTLSTTRKGPIGRSCSSIACRKSVRRPSWSCWGGCR